MTDEQLSQQPETAQAEQLFTAALRYVKAGRWTEAKKALEEIEQIEPNYRNVATLKQMVEETIETSKFGFGVPAHIGGQGGHDDLDDDEGDYHYEAPPRDEDWKPRLGCVFVAVAVVAAAGIFAYLMLFKGS